MSARDDERSRKREQQRARRQGRVRIDYMPSAEALRILRECHCCTLSATIDELILAAAAHPWRRLPVRCDQPAATSG